MVSKIISCFENKSLDKSHIMLYNINVNSVEKSLKI